MAETLIAELQNQTDAPVALLPESADPYSLALSEQNRLGNAELDT